MLLYLTHGVCKIKQEKEQIGKKYYINQGTKNLLLRTDSSAELLMPRRRRR